MIKSHTHTARCYNILLYYCGTINHEAQVYRSESITMISSFAQFPKYIIHARAVAKLQYGWICLIVVGAAWKIVAIACSTHYLNRKSTSHWLFRLRSGWVCVRGGVLCNIASSRENTLFVCKHCWVQKTATLAPGGEGS